MLDNGFPHVDTRLQDSITDEQAEFFRGTDVLVIQNMLRAEPIARQALATLGITLSSVSNPPG